MVQTRHCHNTPNRAGIGFGKAMSSAEMFIASLDASGQAIVTRRKSTGQDEPPLVANQDFLIIQNASGIS
jgi:hypothetical protein